jgi:hypothetical protein
MAYCFMLRIDLIFTCSRQSQLLLLLPRLQSLRLTQNGLQGASVASVTTTMPNGKLHWARCCHLADSTLSELVQALSRPLPLHSLELGRCWTLPGRLADKFPHGLEDPCSPCPVPGDNLLCEVGAEIRELLHNLCPELESLRLSNNFLSSATVIAGLMNGSGLERLRVLDLEVGSCLVREWRNPLYPEVGSTLSARAFSGLMYRFVTLGWLASEARIPMLYQSPTLSQLMTLPLRGTPGDMPALRRQVQRPGPGAAAAEGVEPRVSACPASGHATLIQPGPLAPQAARHVQLPPGPW